MNKCLFYVIATLSLLFLNQNISFAQDDTSGVVVLGGTGKCKISGDSQIKEITTDGNRLVLLKIEGTTQGSIILQKTFTSGDLLVDLSTNAVLGEIKNVKAFLGGKKLSFESENSEFFLKQVSGNGGVTIEISNDLGEGLKGKLKGTIKLTGPQSDLAKGKLNLSFEETKRTITQNSQTNKTDNGKIEIECRFNKIPITRKDGP